MSFPKRLFLEPSCSFEEGLTAALDRDGDLLICISVAEEKAVDSYNDSFECSMHLSAEQAIRLRDWLTAAVSAVNSKTAPDCPGAA